MRNNLNLPEREDSVIKAQFPDCNNFEPKEDIIFTFSDEFAGDIKHVADKLQSATNFLKNVTNINPINFFKSRIIIGFTDKSTQPTWSGTGGNRIRLPIKYLSKKDEPLHVCSHELVHPYYNCSPIHDKNEGWGEGFCDFLRGPVMNIMGLNGDHSWQKMIQDARNNLNSEYHYPAGQFIMKAYEKFGSTSGSINELINDHNAIENFVQFLFNNFKSTSISSYIKPSQKMIEKWGILGKI